MPDAEDLTQGVLVEGRERLGDLRDPARLGSWLRSIAGHRCIERSQEVPAVLGAPVAAHVGEQDDVMVSWQRGIEEGALDERDRQIVSDQLAGELAGLRDFEYDAAEMGGAASDPHTPAARRPAQIEKARVAGEVVSPRQVLAPGTTWARSGAAGANTPW